MAYILLNSNGNFITRYSVLHDKNLKNDYRINTPINTKIVGSAGVPSVSTVSANVTQTVAKEV